MGPGRFGDGDGDGGFEHFGHHGGPLWLPLLIWAITIFGPLALGLLVWTAMRVAEGLKSATFPPPATQPTAMELLRERYVLGDIDGDTFEDMVSRLLQSERWEREQAFVRALPPHLRPAPHPPTLTCVYPADEITEAGAPYSPYRSATSSVNGGATRPIGRRSSVS